MRGVHDHSLDRESVRQVARCHKCHEEREGWTRFESKTYGSQPVGRPIHFCDECEAGIVARPLAVVLADYLGE